MNFANSFQNLLLKVANRWLPLRTLSRMTHQNLVNFQGERMRRCSVIVFAFCTNFGCLSETCDFVILIMILQTFDSGPFSI